jgi:hypothetical protein
LQLVVFALKECVDPMGVAFKGGIDFAALFVGRLAFAL